ncbi:MAG TPA: UDP-N-acetylmuramate--L-alanine ligase [Egibacteraceae bacterium]|nr:UDP-N-acetylmuramate--L-alanine ligase [Egibacteraceae bacterium]
MPTLAPSERVHLVGVGGAGMSALAFILIERGHQVSGSDLRGGRVCAALAAMGATIHVGHAAEHVHGADLVATSSAIPVDNPELVRAAELGIPTVRRAELLAALIGKRRSILVAGTHGKTTTTAMTTVCLQAAGADPSFAIGGALHDAGTSAHHGTGDLFVAEADESDRSFLVFTVHCAVVTNVEIDHHDHYADLVEVQEAFAAFLSRRVAGGLAVVCRDDPGAASLLDRAGAPVLTYGRHPDADLRVVELALDPAGARFRLERRGQDLGPFRLSLAGPHNVLNATAAAGAALWAGAALADVREGLAAFSGATRRFQLVGVAGGVTVVDDYGHHPTELSATLAAARQTEPEGRVVAVFQPHRYSRTAALGAELGAALAAADIVVVTDVYAAGEAPVPGVTGVLVAEAARAHGAETYFVPAARELTDLVAGLVGPGDLVLTLGAGDVTEVGPVLLRRLEGRRA